jgi:hypothetical protein
MVTLRISTAIFLHENISPNVLCIELSMDMRRMTSVRTETVQVPGSKPT